MMTTEFLVTLVGHNKHEVTMHLGIRHHACSGCGGQEPIGRDYQEISAHRQGFERVEPLVIGAGLGEELLALSLPLKQPNDSTGNGDQLVAITLAQNGTHDGSHRSAAENGSRAAGYQTETCYRS